MYSHRHFTTEQPAPPPQPSGISRNDCPGSAGSGVRDRWITQSASLALNISSVLSAFARAQQPDDDSPEGGADSDPARERLAARLSGSEQDPEDPATRRSRQHRPLRALGKSLRREIINVPDRLAHHARGLTVHLHPSQHDGPLVGVYTALAALPSYSGP